jgi:hypothetical protein
MSNRNTTVTFGEYNKAAVLGTIQISVSQNSSEAAIGNVPGEKWHPDLTD